MKGVFVPKSFIILFVLKCWKKSKKRESLGNWFWSLFQCLFGVFSSVYLCCFHFQTLYFLTLELSYLILSIGSCFYEKNCLWFIVITKCCNLFFALALCLSLLCRGDCIRVLVLCLSLLCRGDCVRVLALCPIPLV